jgi:hypothetical protein
VRGGKPSPVGPVAGVRRDVRPRSGPDTLGGLARLALAYLLILAFVAPPVLASTAGPSPHRSHKSGRMHAKARPLAARRVQLSLAMDRLWNPDQSAAVSVDPHQVYLSLLVRTPAFSKNLPAQSRVFRPLRC